MSLNWLARRFLRRAVEARAREVVGKRTPGRRAFELESSPGRCDVALIFALKIEEEAFLRRLGGRVTERAVPCEIQLGRLGSQRVAVACSGPGRTAAGRTTRTLVEAHQPRLVIGAGLAGGLDPTLESSDLVLGSRVLSADRPALQLAPPGGVHPELVNGDLLTVDRVITSPEEKARLRETYQAVAVDMESYAIVEVCRETESPCLIVRVIADTARQRLPPQVERLLRQRSLPSKAGGLLATVAAGPRSVGQLLKLKEAAFEASERLARFLAEIIREFPEPASSTEPNPPADTNERP